MIQEISGEVPVTFLCQYFEVSTSGYYKMLKSQVRAQLGKKQRVIVEIKQIYKKSKGTYGSPRVFQELLRRRFIVSENTVAKYMKELNFDARFKKKFRVKTTDSNHDGPIAPRVFKIEHSTPSGPGKVLAGDITYVRVGSKFVYLAIVMDLFSRRIVGWSITQSLETTGVMNALKMAIGSCGNTAEVIFHSDRGVQYASLLVRDFLSKKEMIPSMSRKGNCYDNAFVESWFKSLKSEWLYRNSYGTEHEVRSLVFEYIEVWYNRQRLHSSLGYQSPLEYEAKQLAA